MLVFGTCPNHLDLCRQKPRSKPKKLLKIFGAALIADISCTAETRQRGLTAAIGCSAASGQLWVRRATRTALTSYWPTRCTLAAAFLLQTLEEAHSTHTSLRLYVSNRDSQTKPKTDRCNQAGSIYIHTGQTRFSPRSHNETVYLRNQLQRGGKCEFATIALR